MPKRLLLVFLFLFSAGPLLARKGESVAYYQQIFSLVVLGLIVGTGLLALNYNHKHNYKGDLSLLAYSLRNKVVQLALFAAGLVALSSLVLPRAQLDTPYEMVEFGRQRGEPRIASLGYRDLAIRYPYVYDYHYEYIAATYERDFWGTKSSIPNSKEEEESPHQHYSRMYSSRFPGYTDISLLGMGISEFYEGVYQHAIRQFRQMRNKDMPFRNLFMGRIHAHYQRSDSALIYYERELAAGTRPELVVPYLGAEYLRLDDVPAMRTLVDNRSFAAGMPLTFKRFLYTREADLAPYFAAILVDWWEGINLTGLLGGLAGLLVWILFLRRVDIYKQEKWFSLAGMVLLGGLCSFAAMPFYDFFQFELGFALTGKPLQDFAYSIIGIGFIEELVKIAPFLFVLRFTKLIRGPLDYILYASLSGLGFAFVENLLYFDQASIGIIHGRVLITSVFHMFATSTVAFGLVLGKYRYGGRQGLFFVLFFLFAAFLHGFYDFWLVNHAASSFFFLAYAVFIYATFQYASYINNCLNNSPIFRGRTTLDMNQLATYLLRSLVLVLLFEYMALNFAYGVEVGNAALFRSLGMGSFMMFFVVLNLSYIDIVQGEWFVLRLWNFGSRQNYNKAIGRRVTLTAARPGSILTPLFPLRGEVIARIKLQADNRYFLVQFDRPASLGKHELEYVLIKSREKDVVIEPGQGTEVAMIVFRGKHALSKRKKDRGDFKLLDYAVVN